MATVLDERLLALTAIITMGFQFAFFIVTYAFRFDKVTDFAGTTNFLLLAIVTLTVGGTYSTRQIVMTTCVLIWGTRLCAFLLYRILLWGEDRRFDDKRENLLKLGVFWSLQAVWVWTVSLPLTIVNSKQEGEVRGLVWADWVGWGVFACGAILEAVADQQKLWFKQREENRGRWTDAGVWAYSRHPNFFGEMVVWWGLYVSGVNQLEGAEHAAVVGPIFITLLLMFVSGIPLLERGWDSKYGRNEGYWRYKRRTSVLIPFVPQVYERLPEWVKHTVLLDFKFYNPGPPKEEDEKVGGGANEETSLMEGRKKEGGGEGASGAEGE